MSWLLAQQSLTPPELEPVQRAFRATGLFHPLDAHSFLRDAFGVLAKNLSVEDARRLQGALAAEGVSTDVVAQAEWPVLPPAKRIVRAAYSAEGFAPFDPLGRELHVPWDRIVAVSAGLIREVEFGQRVTASVAIGRVPAPLNAPSMGFPGRSGDGGTFAYGPALPADRLVLTGEERNWRWGAEVFVNGGLRFTWQAHEFNYAALGERRAGEPEVNFAAFLRDLLAAAPHAALNRGAFQLREGQVPPLRYPTRGAFQEESAWLLWRLLKAGRYAGPATA